MEKRNHIFAASYVFIKKDSSVLLMRRYNTGYKDGSYTLPAGHIDEGELPKVTAIREVKEETNIDIAEDATTCKHTMYRISDDGKVYVDYYFMTEDWSGEPEITEPHKCDDMQWFNIDELPENTLPSVLLAIQNMQNNEPFSEVVETA